jgi:probable F420-dependent oxidoreductase
VDQDWWDPFAVLGLWTGITSVVRLQTSVLVLPYRNPIVTAKMLASIDALSGGRLEVGVGSGWMEEEFRLLGAPPFAARGAVTDQYIGAFRSQWRDPAPAFSGEYVSFSDLAMHPKPAQAAGIPVLVGGTSVPAMRRAAQLGDGWQPLKISPDALRSGLTRIRAMAQDAGRGIGADYQVSVRYGVRITADADDRRPGEDDDRVLVGTPTQVLARLLELEDAGATDVMLDTRTNTPDEVDATLTAFEREIIPRLR